MAPRRRRGSRSVRRPGAREPATVGRDRRCLAATLPPRRPDVSDNRTSPLTMEDGSPHGRLECPGDALPLLGGGDLMNLATRLVAQLARRGGDPNRGHDEHRRAGTLIGPDRGQDRPSRVDVEPQFGYLWAKT